MNEDLASEVILDLLRSAWIIERARAFVYRTWTTHEPRFEAAAERATERAGLVAVALDQQGRGRDDGLVEPHARWIRNLVGDVPGEVPFSDLFVARLGDWVDSHAGVFLGESEERLKEIGKLEHESVQWPESLPPPPPYEPLPTPEVEPPGPRVFRFGLLGDMHVGSSQGDEMVAAAIADLNASGAELVIQLGDITDHGDKGEFELARSLLVKLEMPWATMMGNHDAFSTSEKRLSGREYYPQWFERQPDGILLEHKGWRFAVLDSAAHGASPFAPFDLASGTFLEGPGGAIVRGSLTEPQHDLLADIAAPGSAPAFICLHHPPQPFTSFPPVLFGLRDADSGRLHATVDSGNVWAVFAGHTHRNARTREFDGVVAQEVGIPRDYPFGYALVDVADEGFAYRWVQVSDEKLLRKAYERSGVIHRRYARGEDHERAFVWSPGGGGGGRTAG